MHLLQRYTVKPDLDGNLIADLEYVKSKSIIE